MPQMFLGGQVQITRRPTNPLDKTTIVNLFPKEIKDENPTLAPNLTIIPAAPSGDFSFITVGSGSWFKELDEGQPHLEIQVNSLDVANGIVTVFKTSVLASNGADVCPGIFTIPGAFKTKELVKEWINPLDPVDNFKSRYREANEAQKKWFHELVLIADSDWAVTNGNPRSVSEISRLAALELGFKDKPWLQDFASIRLTPCPACGSLGNPDFPICPNCKAVVNKSRAKELGIVFAADLTPAAK